MPDAGGKGIRIGVLSDTHHDEGGIRRAMLRLQAEGTLDALCFLGDCATDLPAIERCLGRGSTTAVYAVRGNNDFLSALPDERVITLGGKKLLLVHGHLQRVKMHWLSLVFRAQEAEVDIALFGHTHSPHCGYEQGVLLLNPGAASGACPSCALLIIENGTIKPVQCLL